MTDLALLLHRHGYDAVATDRRARGGATTYVSQLMGRRAVVLGGEAGARAFYDESLVERRGAVPLPLGGLLFGRGAVHALDGDVHRDRKLMFLEALSVEKLTDLYARVRTGLETAREGWPRGPVALHDELVRVYGDAILAWAGIKVSPRESERISRGLAAIVNGFGISGAAYPRAWAHRVRLDRWAARQVREVRSGRSTAAPGSALREIAANHDLDDRTAGVELLNVLRPTVAVAWLGTFAGAALADAPDWRRRLTGPDSDVDAYAFAQEVRRTAPFVPVLAGRARRAAYVNGVHVRRRDRLVLDVHGIDRDPAIWADAQTFRPDRFLVREPNAFELVPQGGGHPSGHRCPGESVALGLLMETARVLAATEYHVAGSTQPDRNRIPTLPEGGLVLRDVSVLTRS